MRGYLQSIEFPILANIPSLIFGESQNQGCIAESDNTNPLNLVDPWSISCEYMGELEKMRLIEIILRMGAEEKGCGGELLIVILLIGTGWPLLKPILQDVDKVALMILIPLQVSGNAASIVLGDANEIVLMLDMMALSVVIVTCKRFDKFGRLTDVYMAQRKTRSGFNYAFIRYTGVQDMEGLERNLVGTKINGKNVMANIARTLLVFDNSLAAKKFKEEEHRWNEMLKWVSWEEQLDMRFERVAWIHANSYSDGSSDVNMDDEDDGGISDTWRENIESEEEEGEFRTEDDKDSNYHMHEIEQDRVDPVIRDDMAADEPRKSPDVPTESEVLKTENIDSSNSPHVCHGGVSRMVEEQTQKVDNNSDLTTLQWRVETHSAHNDQPNTSQPFGAGPLNGLVNSRCFGPFPSHTNTILDSPSEPNEQRFDIGGSVGKRRRLLKVNSCLPTSSIGEPQIRMNLEKTLFPLSMLPWKIMESIAPRILTSTLDVTAPTQTRPTVAGTLSQKKLGKQWKSEEKLELRLQKKTLFCKKF
ncbi:hypothetical protein L1887_36141 [Cichorium endivia]|nr:hypothetical protein L1887_36141 [Cichorium endivia]